jgi:hypothetical protein
MSMSAHELRQRGLNFVRRQIAAGKATEQDIERWEKELGDEVRKIAQEATPRRRARSTTSTDAGKEL